MNLTSVAYSQRLLCLIGQIIQELTKSFLYRKGFVFLIVATTDHRPGTAINVGYENARSNIVEVRYSNVVG